VSSQTRCSEHGRIASCENDTSKIEDKILVLGTTLRTQTATPLCTFGHINRNHGYVAWPIHLTQLLRIGRRDQVHSIKLMSYILSDTFFKLAIPFYFIFELATASLRVTDAYAAVGDVLKSTNQCASAFSLHTSVT
jgi:hypothetical protein